MGDKPDFSGYATKAGLRCSDGRTITAEAFKHMDGMKVPLVWQHGHSTPENVLGHTILEARVDGVYAQGFFNDTPAGQNAKALVLHKDITAMSIYANQLVEKAKSVLHGVIREVSLVLSGANPGALIDFVNIAHGDGSIDQLEDEAIIYTGLTLEHGDSSNTDEATEAEATEDLEHAGETVQDIYDSLTEEQQGVVTYIVGAALKAAREQEALQQSASDKTENTDEGDLTHQEGSDDMTSTRNVFEKTDGATGDKHVLTHAAMKGIVADAVKGGSLKEAVEAYALTHGIESIGELFPDAKAISDRPEWIKRRTDWVQGVIGGARKTPFSRIKSMTADLTLEDARAKGYVKGNLKKEQFFAISKRVTTPQTIYKKQKLDRDDIVDITDFDVVAWLKTEMRFMLEEELARAILIGDGREVDDEDKIIETNIRPIATDDELYVTTVYVNIGDANSSYNEIVEEVLLARRYYKGTGTPTFYTTEETLTRMLLAKDTLGRRFYNTVGDLAAALRVDSVVSVEVMEDETDLVGIIVNMADYVLGADRGGEINLFDDFDIDYNQYKYLIETRVSGALTKVKAAIVVRKTDSANELIVPTAPTFVAATGVVTIPTQTGTAYFDMDDLETELTAGAQAAIAAGETIRIRAVPDTGYYYSTNAADEWSFTRPAV